MQQILRTFKSTIAADSDHPFLQGPFKPAMDEWLADTDSMKVIGEIPKDLHGIYVRNTHNQVHESIGIYHPFDGDGMLHAMHFENGKATHAVFDRVVAALPSGIKVHAVDNPPLITVEEIAQALLMQLPQKFWLAGFSFGGYVALAMLEAAPERIAGLALLCSSPFADSLEASQKRIAALEGVAQGRYFEMVEAQASNAFHPDSLQRPELLAARRQMVQAYGPQNYEAHVRATAARPDRTHVLNSNLPILVVSASHDKVMPPAMLARYAQAIPGARYEMIEEAGHLAPMEKPQLVALAMTQWIVGTD
jgi:pimeloyl-ACP methyl ester carboxylesterase